MQDYYILLQNFTSHFYFIRKMEFNIFALTVITLHLFLQRFVVGANKLSSLWKILLIYVIIGVIHVGIIETIVSIREHVFVLLTYDIN